jgi:hypothetical protein
VVVAAVWTLLTRPAALDAAIEIDRRFGLKERVSSSLALSDRELETEIGQALVADTSRRIERIDLTERFKVRPTRWSLLPLAPATAAILVALLFHPAIQQEAAAARTQSVAEKKSIENSAKALSKKLQQRRQLAQKEGLKEAENLLNRLEKGTEQLTRDAQADRKKALVDLNDLAKDIAKRQSEVAGAKQLQEQLNRWKNLDQGPADRLARAMKQGDFRAAADELNRLQERLRQGDLNEEDRKQLAKQLNQMKEKLENIQKAHEAKKEELQKQIDQAEKNGQQDKAEELKKQLDQLRQQQPQMQQLNDMAQSLAQCEQCMAKGDSSGAMSALEDMESTIQSLAQQSEEMEMWEGSMQDIAQAKESMNCKQCKGQGCAACRGGEGQGQGQGQGLGAGRGTGHRPENENPTNTRDTGVRIKPQNGSAAVVDLVDGPTAAGQSRQEIASEFEKASSAESDPLTGQQLPRGYKEHAKGYFDALHKGE